jgi:uncharacterized protein with HEPN domain
VRTAHPEIPWRDITGLRNILVHAYDVVTPRRLRETAVSDLPRLIEQLDAIVAELEASAD